MSDKTFCATDGGCTCWAAYKERRTFCGLLNCSHALDARPPQNDCREPNFQKLCKLAEALESLRLEMTRRHDRIQRELNDLIRGK